MSDPRYKSGAGEHAVLALYDRLLTHWPVPHEFVTIPTRHGNTTMIASGEPTAPPLLLLHGSCSNSLSWMGDVQSYSRHFRVYTVDLPGEPGKSSPDRPPFTGPAYAEWLTDLLDGLKAPQVHLLGLSMGGYIALKFATHHPDRVSRLVLLAPGGVVNARLFWLLRVIFLSNFGRRGAEAINRITFGETKVDPEAIAFMNLVMTHFRARFDPQPLFTDDELKRLTMPTLLIAGTRDAILPSEKIAARLQRLVPNLTARLLQDAGHVLVNLTDQINPFLLEPAKA
ncbi:MAG TPA: alpha/beta fold hydrolase [Symbiobacteriaceae bacterium]|nr:alpha/beta fold hydrolase [Symbiobacteriaceae bacterium]